MPRNQHPDTRLAILQTALRLIHQKGINDVSLRHIARELSLSPSSLYEYFDSKDAIMDELRRLGWSLFNSYFEESAAQASPQERLRSLCIAYLRFARENSETFNLLFLVSASKRKRLSESVPADSPYGKLLAVIREGLAAGIFDQRVVGNAEAGAYSLWAMVHGMATLQNTHLVSFEADWEQAAQDALTIFITGMMVRFE
ncbi:MAG: TetR/AcrR family transcriptional regulator [Anaerolineae bacterium]|nr:TetR/AcrR family transcriptional regulator [Anaerolineae bacterium]